MFFARSIHIQKGLHRITSLLLLSLPEIVGVYIGKRDQAGAQ
jgi:hypothetical protein